VNTIFSKFMQDESGATAIEYALLAGIVGVGVITSLTAMKTALNTTFNSSATSLNGAVGN
jgi:pilus assembly protein Flp/PilA